MQQTAQAARDNNAALVAGFDALARRILVPKFVTIAAWGRHCWEERRPMSEELLDGMLHAASTWNAAWRALSAVAAAQPPIPQTDALNLQFMRVALMYWRLHRPLSTGHPNYSVAFEELQRDIMSMCEIPDVPDDHEAVAYLNSLEEQHLRAVTATNVLALDQRRCGQSAGAGAAAREIIDLTGDSDDDDAFSIPLTRAGSPDVAPPTAASHSAHRAPTVAASRDAASPDPVHPGIHAKPGRDSSSSSTRRPF